MNSKIIQNAVWIPEDNVYLVSSHVHDYRTHKFKDGHEYDVDGGREYIRRGATSFDALNSRVEDYCLSENSPIKDIREKLLWGSRGKDGKSPLRYSPIRTLEADHLQAILDNVPQIHPTHEKIIKYWLNKKKK
jgi:hypothetical protein